MDIQLFKFRNSYTDQSSKVDFTNIIDFQKGNNNNILKLVDYNTFDDELIYKCQKVIQYDIKKFDKSNYHHLIFVLLKGRKKLQEYVYDGVYKLSKEKLNLSNFNTMPYSKFETIIRSYNKGLYDLVKTLLPCYTMCYFKNNSSKSKDNVIGHSGYIRFDIDNELSDIDIENLKKMEPYAIIPSTSGIPSPIFRIDISDKMIKKCGNINNLHTYYWHFFDEELRKIGIQVDEACKNINRLFYVSVNKEFEHYYFNDKPKCYELPESISLIKENSRKTYEDREKYIEGLPDDLDIDNVKLIINKEIKNIYEQCKINNIQPFFDGSNMRHSIRNFYYSLANILNREEIEGILCEFLLLTSSDERITDDKYKERDINYLREYVFDDDISKSYNSWKYVFTFAKGAKELINIKRNQIERETLMESIENCIKSFSDGRYPRILLKYINDTTSIQTIRNLYHFLTLEKHHPGFYIDNISDVRNFHIGFLKMQYNILTDRYVINDEEFDSFERIYNTIQLSLDEQKTITDKGYKKSITLSMRDYMKTIAIDEVNPVKEYFHNLSKNNGHDMIDKVRDIFNDCTENEAGNSFLDWCYGVVKNALDPNYYDRILYLYAPKGGEGKTWFIQNDLIPDLKDYISSDFNFNTESKDDKFKMAENIILLDDEGSKTSKRQDDIRKSVSSKQKIKERVSFDRTKSTKKRIASIVVCTNSPEISSASNTDRRSLVIHLNDVKHDDPTSFVQRWRNEVNINTFWSQMYNIYGNDRNYKFVSDEHILRDSMNWSQESMATILVQRYLRKPTQGERNYFIEGHVIIREMIEKASGRKLDTSLLGIMKKLGFVQISKPTKTALCSERKKGFKFVIKDLSAYNGYVTGLNGYTREYNNPLEEFEEENKNALLNAVNKIIN